MKAATLHAGSALPALCAVHCALTPVLAPLLPLIAAQATEAALMALLLPLGLATTLLSLRLHGQKAPAALSLAGLAGMALAPAAPLETPLKLAAGLLVASGSLWSFRLCRCSPCQHERTPE